MHRGYPDRRQFFALQEPLERRDRVVRREARKTTRGDLAHPRVAIEQHRDERLPASGILNEREQGHRVSAHAVVVAFQSLDECDDRMRSDDREPRACPVDLLGAAASESPYELGDLGCPGPKRHLK
jgi:hypothetical protein